MEGHNWNDGEDVPEVEDFNNRFRQFREMKTVWDAPWGREVKNMQDIPATL